MRTLKLVTVALVALAALALAGNAFATQRIAVSQTSSSVTIKVSQDQSDNQPAHIAIYMPAGYTVTAGQAPGSKIGTTTGDVFARDLGIPLPLSGDVLVDDPAKHTADACSPGTHVAVWILQLSVAGQTINLPVYVSQTSGAETAFGAAKLEVCLAPADTPQGSPGRSPNGAQLLDATFTVNGVITPPAGATRWISLWTPYATGTGVPNQAGTVEARSFVGPGGITIQAKVLNKKKKLLKISGTVTQSGLPVAGAKVSLLINSRVRFSAKSSSSGGYAFKLQQTLKRVTTAFFQAKATAAARDITDTGCDSPSLPGVQCVSATAGAFTVTSKKVKVRL